MPETNNYNWGERAIFYANRICFPRLTGTEGEKRAAGIIQKRLVELGYQVQSETFPIYKTPWNHTRFLMGCCLILLLISRFLFISNAVMAGVLALVVVFIGIGGGEYWLNLVGRAGKQPIAFSENIWADSNPGENKTKILFCAHYDSKSQTLKLKRRIYWLGSGLGATVMLSLVYFVYPLFPHPWLVRTTEVLLLTGGIVAVRLMVVGTGNESPGALDNASGVGMVLACAEYFIKHPPSGFSARFLFPSAEEFGLQGSIRYVQTHRHEIEDTLVINFDGLGLKGALRWVTSLNQSRNRLVERVIEAAGKTAVSIESLPLYPGLMMDHIPFMKHTSSVVSLCCAASSSGLIHSPDDKSELLESEGFSELGEVIEELVGSLQSARS
ncbi:MAG: M28 family metallopeptidase [bacterium]